MFTLIAGFCFVCFAIDIIYSSEIFYPPFTASNEVFLGQRTELANGSITTMIEMEMKESADTAHINMI